MVVNVTFSVSDKVHGIMRQHKEIRWTELARKPVVELAEKLAGNDGGIDEVVRFVRNEQDASLLAKTGDLQKALELWAAERKKRLAKAKMPSWWKNATGSL
jgi:hypothetical protein